MTECMTGDGNLAVEPTALCRQCLDRPYGAERARPLEGTGKCTECFEPVEVWCGNTWAPKHRPPDTAVSCRHHCHDDEILLAARQREGA